MELLIQALHVQQPVVTKGKKKSPQPADDLAGFALGSFWQTLKEDEEVVMEPEMQDGLYSPTDKDLEGAEKNIEQQPKHNFSEMFDRPPFVGMIRCPVIDRVGKPSLDTKGEPIVRQSVHTKGHARPSFLEKHHLTAKLIPTEFVEPFLPMHKHKVDNNIKGFSMTLLAEWTNYQAI